MKPLKGAQSLGNWFLRLALLLFVFFAYFDQLKSFNFTDFNYIVLFLFALFTLLLFIGGFMRKHSMTVWSGLLVFLLSVVYMIAIYIETKSFGNSALTFLLPAAIGFYFTTKGNNN